MHAEPEKASVVLVAAVVFATARVLRGRDLRINAPTANADGYTNPSVSHRLPMSGSLGVPSHFSMTVA